MSAPETTIRSPSFAPARISTASRLLAPVRIALVRDAVVHDIGVVAAALFEERAALDLQDVAARVEQDARGQALVLAQAGRLLATKRRRAATSPFDDLGRHRRPRASRCRCRVISRGMPMARSRAKLSGTWISTSNAERSTTLSTGALAATFARCAMSSWPTWPSTGEAHVERVDLALEVRDHRALAIGEQLLVAKVEPGAFAEQAGPCARWRGQLGLLQRVLRARHVDLARPRRLEGALVALEVALGRVRSICAWSKALRAFERVICDVERGAAGLGLEPGERGLFLRELAAAARGCRFRPAPGPSSPCRRRPR